MTDRALRVADYARARLWVRLDGRPTVLVPREPPTVRGVFPFDAAVVHVVTASDPGAARLTGPENRARHAALAAEVARRGLTATETRTGAADGTHAETGLLVVGLSDDEARALGTRFAQDAVFRWDRESWSVLPCDPTAPVTRLGWEVFGTRP